ncbi:MAG TPA: hypothetical protein VEV83_17755 [Parafilimonas sp.]|nr:hypothetical protein [Parafilimonas sp.]
MNIHPINRQRILIFVFLVIGIVSILPCDCAAVGRYVHGLVPMAGPEFLSPEFGSGVWIAFIAAGAIILFAWIYRSTAKNP